MGGRPWLEVLGRGLSSRSDSLSMGEWKEIRSDGERQSHNQNVNSRVALISTAQCYKAKGGGGRMHGRLPVNP